MENNKRIRRMFFVLSILIIVAVIIYFYARVIGKSLDSGLPLTADIAKKIASRSAMSILGMTVSAALIAVVSLAFQTITENRILTPSMIGFDSVFMATQSVLVFLASRWAVSKHLFSNPYLNFLITTGMMMVISMLMYRIILRKNKNNIVFLLLFGLILSGMIRSFTNYIEVLLNPQEFQQLKAVTSVTITNMNTGIILLAAPVMLVLVFLFMRKSREYDVMLLSESNAKSLGVPYTKRLNTNLILIALAMAITTALIGPLTFLGLLAVNIARELFRTYKHSVLFIGSILIAILFLVLGQGIVELLRYATPVTVLIDLVGGVYMICLILKENKL
ncbi:iron chelate uptake ABC transporter family permease subunit [Clostridium sp. D2Q-14]|uniref:iron chelate uptake ABC transporter family permease subunit n=1 Tax=Anaeromonas gelatinilytica TaxID=2683194 RepID=UPI00193BBCEA|nr:iron chelate uptake ABC transporter family permease subunit [Anaeromonas gelatinilytica]MBS4534040.1 iron chelate uptake ABC transporter family permease subunit [Anaeromonas gelatinilytica]